VVCNPVSTAYHPQPTKDRLTVLDVLRGGRERRFRLNQAALSLLQGVVLSQATRQRLQRGCSQTERDEATFQPRLDTWLPKLGAPSRPAIPAAAAVAAYPAETDLPVIRALGCDAAPQFNGLTEARMLCWVHEGRAYKKLSPVVGLHRPALDEFRQRLWEYYHQLLAYRQTPTPQERARLEADFERLLTTRSGYDALDQRMAKTQAKKAALLLVLPDPERPLHNKPAELAVRQRVRKRDVSFGPRTQAGRQAWDTFMSLAETAKKLGVSFYAYVQARIAGTQHIPPLAELVEQAAKELHLGGSWSAARPPPDY